MRTFTGTDVRVRSSEGCTVLDCGCAHTDVAWLQMCDVHAAEWQARHDDALLEHATRPDDWLNN